ncbi:ABC transporter permease [Bacillus chungangensis]|uniref:ABC transport system permease protein n=1 Tax=Bacillus chungangensis TaxID=587633 RepID=A0ABT9WNA3_9BACI|nr:ABC transporter permease [Bacillus chungangensis]MDQ0174758.1 putative ABC transport system permease protein [Bacillus chungangensis]
MFTAIFGSVEQGIIYAIMALGVYLSFRILDFPDLTVDGSFVTGAAIASTMILFGYHPFAATGLALAVGFVVGSMTGILHTKGKINPLLSGILMMIALYSINLRIMGFTSENIVGRSNIPLMNAETVMTIFTDIWENIGADSFFNQLAASIGIQHPPKTWGILLFIALITLFIKVMTDLFLQTEIGLAIRATGDNKRMIRSFSANTDSLIILGLGISNGLVAFSGALIAQYAQFADVGMGIGMIIIGLASVIIGEAIFGTKTIFRTTLAVIGGAIIYRIVLGLALRIKVFDTGDMKFITAVIVIFALITPKIMEKQREKRRKQRHHKKRVMQKEDGRVAPSRTD